MTKEEFIEIKNKSFIPNEHEEWSNHPNSISRYRYDSIEDFYRSWVYDDLNKDGNSVRTTPDGIRYLQCMIHSNTFTDEEWDDILSHIYFLDFNKDFDNLVEKTLPIFKKMPRKFYDDLHLEIWQGIFSFGTHWCCEGKSPEESINSPKNGKLYCDTLLEVYPYFKEFVDKWKDEGQYSLFRFSQAIGPKCYRGILYDN